MQKQDSPYWINVTMESEEAEEKARGALAACSLVHQWTMEMLKTQWPMHIDSGYRVRSSDLIPELTHFLVNKELKGLAQRFSYITTVNRAIARFYQELHLEPAGGQARGEGGMLKIVFPPPYPPTEYQILDIQYRSIWKKYMEKHQRISTHYGSMFLEGEWVKTLLEQSYELEIMPSVLPYLIYSVTVKDSPEGWKVLFNFHKPGSQQGRKRVRQSWQ